ncbi:MAG: ribonuclease D [Brachybacterium faecium]|nr:MAG: ribonuclease D [Brachybacterium faecium]
MPTYILEDLTPEMALQIWTSGRCAVDTETSGLHWERDRLEICQVFSPHTGPVIVRNTGSTPPRLAAVLESRDVLSVFHYAPFDLRFLEAAWGIRAQMVRCTKTASRVQSPYLKAREHSLAPLLLRTLGIGLDKGAVRTSDWSAETLSSEQVDYAIGDVLHLLDLHDELTRDFTDDQHALYRAMCDYMPANAHRELLQIPDPFTY